MPRCKICRDKFEAKYFLQKACLNPKCLAEWAKQDREIKAEKKRKENKKAVKDLNRTSLKWQHAQTQPVFNRMRRLQELKWFSEKGLEPTCISCQKPLGNDIWCNGHFVSVGANGSLRYDKKNSYLQHNRSCNMAKSGDIEGYKKGLIARFGGDKGLAIIDYCKESNTPVKMSWQDIEELRKEFNKEIRLMLQ
ncbi:MAG: hypothetical protein GY738_31000 [Pseudoalteromonas sp.]|nr:hypothetical protein [Pseudoalteromonas sp.]